jgi:chromate reductase
VVNLLGISGSLRAGSFNSMLVREAARVFAPDEFTFADIRLPLYDGDLEAQGMPQSVLTLCHQISAADAVVISTPEYNKGPSGVLKNALDWVSRTGLSPWKDKPLAVMSAAAGRAGGERAQMILRSFMVPFQPCILQGPELHLADSSNQFDENGRLTSDRYIETLGTLMQKLRAEIEHQASETDISIRLRSGSRT